MNKTKLVSVIVPVYNTAKYLSKCLDSILSQLYSNIELILIDDGSTDGSAEICDRYAMQDSRIRVVHQLNAGVSAARNKGLDLAQGDYVLFNDSDDYIESDYIQSFIKVITDESGDWVLGGPMKTQSVIRLNRADFSLLFTHYRMTYRKGCMAKMFSNKIITDNKLRFVEGTGIGEDFIFNLKYLLVANEVAIANIPSYVFVSHPGSLSKSYRDPKEGFIALSTFLNTADEIVEKLSFEEEVKAILYGESLMYIEKLLKDINQLSSFYERMKLYKKIDLSFYDEYKIGNTWKEKILVYLLKHRFLLLYDMMCKISKQY